MAERQQLLRRLLLLAGAITVLILAGTVGFVAFEGDSLLNALVATLDVMATIGQSPAPSTTAGKILKLVLVTLGVGALFYALVTLAEFIVAGHARGVIERGRMQHALARLSGHYIVCSYGRVGRQAAAELVRIGRRVVVIDPDPDSCERAGEQGLLRVHGLASSDEVLREAGVERASGLVACVDSDAENVFITLTARALQPGLEIVARAEQEDTVAKLERAGANRVVSPSRASAEAMAKLVAQPHVSDYLDVVTGSGHALRLEEIELPSSSPAVGRTVEEAAGGDGSPPAVIVAVRKPDGELELRPPPGLRLEAGDMVLAVGSVDAVGRLEGLLGPG